MGCPSTHPPTHALPVPLQGASGQFCFCEAHKLWLPPGTLDGEEGGGEDKHHKAEAPLVPGGPDEGALRGMAPRQPRHRWGEGVGTMRVATQRGQVA